MEELSAPLARRVKSSEAQLEPREEEELNRRDKLNLSAEERPLGGSLF